jgi:predicted nucleic acid-binding Zn ribbon protein
LDDPWRGDLVVTRRDDGGQDPGVARVGEVLARLIRKLGIEGELAGQGALERWDEVVGERIADVTRPRAVSRGTLFVEVRSSAWLSELNLMRRDIMARLNAGAGEGGRIEKIVFVLGEGPSGGGGGEEPPKESVG